MISPSQIRTVTDWYIRESGWNKQLFSNPMVQKRAKDYWVEHRDFLETITDSIRKYAKIVKPYTMNDFKRWPILNSTENWAHKEPYRSYDEAIDSLNCWIRQRIKWIDNNVE